MFVFCLCCMIGAIIYSWYEHAQSNNNRNIGRFIEPIRSRANILPEALGFRQESGPVIYYANDAHNNIDREYRFNYKYVGGGWRAYILRTPSFSDRRGTHIHMLSDNGSYYICWDRTVHSIHDMQIISKQWADNYQEYLSTGKSF